MKSMKINEINENHWKPLKNKENHWTDMETNENQWWESAAWAEP